MDSNRKKRTRDYLSKRNKPARKILRHTLAKIVEFIPTEHKGYGRWFLEKTEDIPDAVIVWCCEEYLRSNYVYQGKGFAFLTKMCENRYENRNKLSEYEKMMLGSTPPKREVPL